jgi:hypothetical protein
MPLSIETLGTMAAKRRGGFGHTDGSAALVDWTTNRLIQAVREMVSVPASRSMVSTVSCGSSSCTSRRCRASLTVVMVAPFERRKKPRGADAGEGIPRSGATGPSLAYLLEIPHQNANFN